MADVPQRLKPPGSTTSLAEMAARAAQRATSNRPPPPPAPVHAGFGQAPSSPPPYHQHAAQPGHASSRTGGSGLIHLQGLQLAPGAAPVLESNYQHLSAPPTVRRAALEGDPLPRKGSRGWMVGLVVGLLVVGAAYAMKRGTNPVSVGRNLIASIRNSNEPQRSQQFTVNDTSPPMVDAPARANAKSGTESATPGVRGLDPTRLPAITPPEATDVEARGAPKPAARAPTRPAVEAPAPPPRPAPVARAPEPKPEPPAPSQPEPTGLAGAIKKAVGPQEPPPKSVAAEAPETPAMRGDIPETPPQGAIQGAIGAHRQAARACIDGQDSASRATIVFASTGKVQSVNVAGPAAGTRAEGCIVKTLLNAAVGPFRRPSFSVTTTISPP